MNKGMIRLLAGAGLFGLWGLLVVMQVPHTAELVQGINSALVGLGVFHAIDSRGVEKSPTRLKLNQAR